MRRVSAGSKNLTSYFVAGYDPQSFTWDNYLEETKAKSAPTYLFNAVRQQVLSNYTRCD